MGDLLTDSFFLPDEDSPKYEIKHETKKRRHQVTEQKGRARINVQILDLKNLLPECRFVPTTKASVLECASSSIRRLQALASSLSDQNKSLIRENKKLHAELNRLRDSGVFVQTFSSDPLDELELDSDLFASGSGEFVLSPDQLFLGSPPKSSFLSCSSLPDLFPGVINVMEGVELPDLAVDNRPLSCSSDADPFVTDYTYSSPSAGSSPLYSPNSSQSFLTFSGSDLSSPDSSDQDFDPSSFTRFTKRRLLFVFLFMIPLFLTLEPFFPAGIQSDEQKGTTREMLGSAETERSILTFDDYWDIVRVIWYVIGGIMGISWLVNALLWANKLSEDYTYKTEQVNNIKKVNNKGRDSSVLKKKAMRTAAKMRIQT